MILNRSKNGLQVRKTVQTQRIIKIKYMLHYSTLQNKHRIHNKSNQLIRLDTDASRIRLGLDNLKWLNLLSTRLEKTITDFPCSSPAHPMESMTAIEFSRELIWSNIIVSKG